MIAPRAAARALLLNISWIVFGNPRRDVYFLRFHLSFLLVGDRRIYLSFYSSAVAEYPAERKLRR